MSGGAGDDIMYGDTLYENLGNPGGGNDTMSGGDGNDYMSGGFGNDVMNGYAHRVIQQPAPPYRIDEYGSIWRDGEDPFRLYAYPIMLTARCRDKDGREYYTFSVGREDKTWVDFDIKAADLASVRASFLMRA